MRLFTSAKAVRPLSAKCGLDRLNPSSHLMRSASRARTTGASGHRPIRPVGNRPQNSTTASFEWQMKVMSPQSATSLRTSTRRAQVSAVALSSGRQSMTALSETPCSSARCSRIPSGFARIAFLMVSVASVVSGSCRILSLLGRASGSCAFWQYPCFDEVVKCGDKIGVPEASGDGEIDHRSR